jgi:hypothetical protein
LTYAARRLALRATTRISTVQRREVIEGDPVLRYRLRALRDWLTEVFDLVESGGDRSATLTRDG